MCFMSPRLRAFPAPLVLAAGISCLSTAAFAQSAPMQTTARPSPTSTGDTIRLTDAQREAILNASTEDSAAAARGERIGSLGDRPGRGIHGEVGVMIGTNGTRGAYGVAEVPLGDRAGAVVSFESSRYGYRR